MPGRPESPRAAWEGWTRKGVAQFRQPHNFMPGLRQILEAELPDVQDALCRAGASKCALLNPLPPILADRSPRPIDDKLWTFTARRPVGECVFANAAYADRRITIRRGVRVTDLLAGANVLSGVPHVIGVRSATGEEWRADLVIDATAGSRAARSGWRESARGSRTKTHRIQALRTTRSTSAARILAMSGIVDCCRRLVWRGGGGAPKTGLRCRRAPH